MKRFLSVLLILTIVKIGAAYAATPTSGVAGTKILFGTTNSSGAGVNQVLALLVGARGVPGPAGVAGPRGFTGLNGQNGQDGLPGAPGAVGPQGPAGPAGAAGPAGPAGPSGPAGPKGDTGAAGSGATGSASLGNGTVTVGTCDDAVNASFTSTFSSGVFYLNTITFSNVLAACEGKTLNVYFTMNSASSGLLGAYAINDVIKCSYAIPTGATPTINITRNMPTCTNTTTNTNLGTDLWKIGARDFANDVGVEIL